MSNQEINELKAGDIVKAEVRTGQYIGEMLSYMGRGLWSKCSLC